MKLFWRVSFQKTVFRLFYSTNHNKLIFFTPLEQFWHIFWTIFGLFWRTEFQEVLTSFLVLLYSTAKLQSFLVASSSINHNVGIFSHILFSCLWKRFGLIFDLTALLKSSFDFVFLKNFILFYFLVPLEQFGPSFG